MNARLIHEYLESKQKFYDWIKNRIKYGGFVEGKDYIVRHKVMPLFKTRQKLIDYHITRRMAEHLGMMEKNEKGSQIRDYFIMRDRQLQTLQKRLANQAYRKAEKEWIEGRKAGKVARRAETDTIQEFVEYARKQGSNTPGWYYKQITKMTNQALFIVEEGLGKPKYFRDLLDTDQHSYLQTAEIICRKALEYGMAEGMHYKKEIYPHCRDKVEAFAETVGKTVVLSEQPLLPEQPLLC